MVFIRRSVVIVLNCIRNVVDYQNSCQNSRFARSIIPDEKSFSLLATPSKAPFFILHSYYAPRSFSLQDEKCLGLAGTVWTESVFSPGASCPSIGPDDARRPLLASGRHHALTGRRESIMGLGELWVCVDVALPWRQRGIEPPLGSPGDQYRCARSLHSTRHVPPRAWLPTSKRDIFSKINHRSIMIITRCGNYILKRAEKTTDYWKMIAPVRIRAA